MKKFSIKSPHRRLITWVIVHDTLKEMQDAADKHEGTNNNEGVLGVHHAYTRLIIKKGKKDVLSKDVGIIRLAKTHLATIVVAHELVHAALWQYRVLKLDSDTGKEIPEVNLGNKCGEDEEMFAHLYGDLFRDMTKKLYKFGFW